MGRTSRHDVDHAVDSSTGTIRSLVCPTRDRPRLLERALTSYAAPLARQGRDVEILVSDDSERPAIREATKAMLSRLTTRFGLRVAHVGIDAREKLASELARASGVSPEIARFAVLGLPRARIATGANRNTLLLLTSGQAVLSVDDDTRGPAVAAPGAEAGVQLLSEDRFSSSHPADVWTFPDLDSALAALDVPVEDPIDAHERFLGRSLRGWLADEARDRDALSPEGNARDRVVRVTLNGLVGEPTWPSAMGYLFLTGSSFHRLTSSRSTYRAALAGRCVVKAVRRATIVDRCHHAPALFVGLDNRELLPPFLPVGRGQDIVWWECLAHAFERASIAHLPFVMVHAPPGRRRFVVPRILRGISRLPLNRVVAALIRAEEDAPRGARSAAADAEALRRLGARLVAVGHAPAPAFARYAAPPIRRDLEELFDHLDRRLEETREGPRLWRQDVERLLWIARRVLARRDVFLPWDLADTGVTGGRQEGLQGLVRAYGHLLEAWPRLVQASRELRARHSDDLIPRLSARGVHSTR